MHTNSVLLNVFRWEIVGNVCMYQCFVSPCFKFFLPLTLPRLIFSFLSPSSICNSSSSSFENTSSSDDPNFSRHLLSPSPPPPFPASSLTALSALPHLNMAFCSKSPRVSRTHIDTPARSSRAPRRASCRPINSDKGRIPLSSALQD